MRTRRWSGDDFMCTCDAESEAEAEEVYAAVLETLECTPETLLTTVVISLNRDYGARIVGIAADMWSRVDVESYDGDWQIAVECDEVEHGVARAWQLVAERYPRSTR